MMLKNLLVALVAFSCTAIGAKDFYAALCKTRDEKKVYAAEATGTDKAAKEEACDTGDNVADATEVKTFKTEAEMKDFLAKNSKMSVMTCQINVNKQVYRAESADCGKNAQQFECPSKSTQLLGCATFNKGEEADKQGLLEAPTIGAQVKCRLKTGGEITVPGTSCSKADQEGACQKKTGFGGQPIDCKELG